MTNKKQDSSAKGMKTMSSFFSTVAASSNTASMGLDSNLRKGSVKASKANATTAKHKSRKKTSSPKEKQQTTIDGKAVKEKPSVALGTKVCPVCEAVRLGLRKPKDAHDPTCPKSNYYKKSNGGKKTKLQMLQESFDAELKNVNQPKFSGPELHTSKNKTTQNDVDRFLRGRVTSPPSSPPARKECLEVENVYSIDNLKKKINGLMAAPTYQMKNSKSVPMVVGAAIETLCELQKVRCKANSNSLMASNPSTEGYKKLQQYRKVCPPGTIGFTFPRDDKSKQPDFHYSQLEGKTIYMTRWELNVPGIFLPCFEC